jgi:hypothetical protein
MKLDIQKPVEDTKEKYNELVNKDNKDNKKIFKEILNNDGKDKDNK